MSAWLINPPSSGTLASSLSLLWKPGPGDAAGLTDAKEYTQNLFWLKMVRPGKETGAGGGGPRDMGAAVGKPGAGALRATRPAPGTTAGEQAVKGASSTIACLLVPKPPQSIDRPFIVLTEKKFSYRHIPVWARYSPHRTRVEAHANTLSP